MRTREAVATVVAVGGAMRPGRAVGPVDVVADPGQQCLDLLGVVGRLSLQQKTSVARPDAVRRLSQAQHHVADGGRLGQERVVTGVELHDAACPTSELALPFGGSAPVLGADEVRRSHVLPDG
jgi:hypothetical protein